MGWIIDGAYDHEGWVANVLDDGRVTAGSTAGGVIVTEPTADDLAAGLTVRQYPATGDIDVVIPWNRVASWRTSCQCGWTGPQIPAHTDQHGNRDCPEQIENEILAPAWREHVAPLVALADLEDMTDRLRTLERQITSAVTQARTAGAPWTQIGRATGLTKQGAQQRWGRPIDATET